MKSVVNDDFRLLYSKLPTKIQILAKESYILWRRNHLHPSLHYKKLNKYLRSVRIGIHFRAIGRVENNCIVWFWIGTHEEYNNFI